MRKPTIIFDFDGTLANSIDVVLDIYNKISSQYGTIEIKKSEFSVLRELGYKKAMKQKNIRITKLPALINHVFKQMKLRIGEVEPYPGIIETLQNLQKDGYAIGVLSSNQQAIASEFFQNHNFPTFMFTVFERTLFGKDKALKKIMKRNRLTSRDIIYVGDEPRDVSACRKLNIPVIGVSWGIAGGEKGFGKHQPDKLVSSTEEMLKTIQSYPW